MRLSVTGQYCLSYCLNLAGLATIYLGHQLHVVNNYKKWLRTVFDHKRNTLIGLAIFTIHVHCSNAI